MTESERRGGDGEPDGRQAGGPGPERLGNPTRLVPGDLPPAEHPEEPFEIPTPAGDPMTEGQSPPTSGRGSFGPMFGPRTFGNGRIQVWGCSPGCLIASLVASVVLTLLLNMLL